VQKKSRQEERMLANSQAGPPTERRENSGGQKANVQKTKKAAKNQAKKIL